MATPAVIEIDPLLEPIAGDSPAGADIRADASPSSAYYKIKDARSAARAAERGNIDEAAAVPDEWDTVVDTGAAILATMAKDLEVAAWMTEALVRVQGFPGLRDGFRLINGLAEKYWDQIFPLPDEEGILTRVAAVTGLNGEGADGTLVLPIRKAQITAGDQPYAFWQFEQATELEKVTDAARKKARTDAGDVSMDLFTASVRQTPSGFFVDLAADIAEAQQAFEQMNATLKEKAGADAPPSSKIREMLEAVQSAIRFVAGDKLAAAAAEAAEAAPAAAAEEGATVQATDAAAGGAAKRANGAYTRDQAFADLSRIAEFFRKTEPHSPISYTIDEVVRRGKLPLPDLLAELIQDVNQRKAFMVAAGIKPPEG
jgi:type VI secretion system protein ImpA